MKKFNMLKVYKLKKYNIIYIVDMENLTCGRCGKQFERKLHYEKHLARKTPCTKVNVNKEVEVPCRRCGKIYSCRASLSRHKKSCEKKDDSMISRRKPHPYYEPNLNITNFYDMRGEIPGFMSDLVRKNDLVNLVPALIKKIYFNDNMISNWSWAVREKKVIYFSGTKWVEEDSTIFLKQLFLFITNFILNNLSKNITIFLPTGEVDLVDKYNKIKKIKERLDNGSSLDSAFGELFIFDSKKVFDCYANQINNDLSA